MTPEPPVTPQELRSDANTIYAEMKADIIVARMRSLADWLELHVPLYREALELHTLYQTNDASWRENERRKALLGKVKGE